MGFKGLRLCALDDFTALAFAFQVVKTLRGREV